MMVVQEVRLILIDTEGVQAHERAKQSAGSKNSADESCWKSVHFLCLGSVIINN